MKALKFWVAIAGLVTWTGTSHATLVSQGNGTVKDTATNLIWLQDWNVNGSQNWATQKSWAENLVFAGSGDWVLPSIDQYSALFSAYGSLTHVSEFTNVQFGFYWSSTEAPPVPEYARWIIPDFGLQGADFEVDRMSAVAVRTGDVSTSVPEPQTLALALMGLGAAALARRRPTH